MIPKRSDWSVQGNFRHFLPFFFHVQNAHRNTLHLSLVRQTDVFYRQYDCLFHEYFCTILFVSTLEVVSLRIGDSWGNVRFVISWFPRLVCRL